MKQELLNTFLETDARLDYYLNNDNYLCIKSVNSKNQIIFIVYIKNNFF